MYGSHNVCFIWPTRLLLGTANLSCIHYYASKRGIVCCLKDNYLNKEYIQYKHTLCQVYLTLITLKIQIHMQMLIIMYISMKLS